MCETRKELNKVLNTQLPDKLIDKISKVERNHFDIETTPDRAYDLMKFLHEEVGIYFLSTVSGFEEKDHLSVCYHVMHRNEQDETEVPINFYVLGIDKEKPITPSMCDFFISADYYEREVHDFFGIVFEGHPYLERIILPEDWPSDIHPLRKEYSWQELKEKAEEIVRNG